MSIRSRIDVLQTGISLHIKIFTDMHKTYSINYKDQNTSYSASS